MSLTLPDPFQAVRRLVSEAVSRRLDRLLSSAAALPGAVVSSVQNDLQRRAEELMDLLATLPHAVADRVADSFRGPLARPPNAAEARLVTEAFGTRVPPERTRLVPGPGLSAFAAAAFVKGNPAITIGNTMYIKPSFYRAYGSDMSRTYQGVEMLLHEYTHVIQYAALGYGTFGRRYARELHAHGYNPDRLYDYDHRSTTYQTETLEGQAAIVGDYAAARLKRDPQSRALAEQLRRRLQGTGIYAQ
jgi:hypothetical protein